MKFAALVILALSLPASAAGQPLAVGGFTDIRASTEELVANSQVLGNGAACTRPGDTDEIVVCGRSQGDDRYRLTFPDSTRSTGTARTGEDARAALALNSDPCSPVGPMPSCSGGLNLGAVASFLIRAMTGMIDPDAAIPTDGEFRPPTQVRP